MSSAAVSEANPQTAGTGASVVLTPHLNGIEPECEKGLQQLEQSGVRVVRRGGCSAIDVACNEMLSDALHDGAESILFIDSDMAASFTVLEEPLNAAASASHSRGRIKRQPSYVDELKRFSPSEKLRCLSALPTVVGKQS
jgi:hypothetical protein